MTNSPKDRRATPVKKIVAMGESNTWGYSVSTKEKCWVSQVAKMLEEFQGSPIELINQGIGSNVLTPECPAYEDFSAKPSALERVEKDLIDHKPDMIFLAYALADWRGGTPLEIFRKAYQTLIDKIQSQISPTIILINAYYTHKEWYNQPAEGWSTWSALNPQPVEIYNKIIQELAAANDLILADVYSAEVGVDWLIDPDHCHGNDLGHRIVANRVFETIARNCSFVALQMPKQTLIRKFFKQYGNGPQMPSTGFKYGKKDTNLSSAPKGGV